MDVCLTCGGIAPGPTQLQSLYPIPECLGEGSHESAALRDIYISTTESGHALQQNSEFTPKLLTVLREGYGAAHLRSEPGPMNYNALWRNRGEQVPRSRLPGPQRICEPN